MSFFFFSYLNKINKKPYNQLHEATGKRSAMPSTLPVTPFTAVESTPPSPWFQIHEWVLVFETHKIASHHYQKSINHHGLDPFSIDHSYGMVDIPLADNEVCTWNKNLRPLFCLFETRLVRKKATGDLKIRRRSLGRFERKRMREFLFLGCFDFYG